MIPEVGNVGMWISLFISHLAQWYRIVAKKHAGCRGKWCTLNPVWFQRNSQQKFQSTLALSRERFIEMYWILAELWLMKVKSQGHFHLSTCIFGTIRRPLCFSKWWPHTIILMLCTNYLFTCIKSSPVFKTRIQAMQKPIEIGHMLYNYSMFIVGKRHSPLRISGKWGFLRVSRV